MDPFLIFLILFYLVTRVALTGYVAWNYKSEKQTRSDYQGLWGFGMIPLLGEMGACFFIVVWIIDDGIELALETMHSMIHSLVEVDEDGS